MKIKMLFLILGLFCLSCATNKSLKYDNLLGKFYAIYPGLTENTNYRYFLELKKDSTFYFQINLHDASPRCKGLWSVSNDILLMKCSNVENIGDMLSNAYMNQREFTLIVID